MAKWERGNVVFSLSKRSKALIGRFVWVAAIVLGFAARYFEEPIQSIILWTSWALIGISVVRTMYMLIKLRMDFRRSRP